MRERLPNRRGSELFEVESFELPFTVGVSKYSDGRLAEVFITNHRATSAAGIMASDAAIAASLALQFGCPVDVLRKALSRDSQGNATSPLGRRARSHRQGGWHMSAPQRRHKTQTVDPVAVFIARAEAKALLFASGEIDLIEAVDALQAAAVASGLVADIGQDQVQEIMAAAFHQVRR